MLQCTWNLETLLAGGGPHETNRVLESSLPSTCSCNGLSPEYSGALYTYLNKM